MFSGVIEVDKFAQIGLFLKARFVDKPLRMRAECMGQSTQEWTK